MNVYESCPTFITQRFVLRRTEMADAPGLLNVYGDQQAQAYFNADNCTSDFRYNTLGAMEECISMWRWSYANGWFVRWSILERDVPVGTVEMFRRDDGTDGQGCGVLRIDLRSDREFTDVHDELLEALLPPLHSLVGCRTILTKAAPFMQQRIASLKVHGFRPYARGLTGEDGRTYGDYWAVQA